MSDVTSVLSNKNFKSHLVPSVVTAALALAVAIPVTAVLSSGNSTVSADTASANTCSVPSTGGNSGVLGASTSTVTTAAEHFTYPTAGGQGNGNGNGNSGNGNGNGNGSGANANGNSQTAVGGLIGGVNAIVPVSALNGSLDGNLSGNTVGVSVPVLSNNDGNSTDVNVLNNVLNAVADIL
jgi:hypothetical protein